MPARQRMTMRVFLQRNSAATNAYGEPSPPVWGALSTAAGYVWVDREDTRHDPGHSVATAFYRGIVPLATDVTESDRVEKVEDRAATQLFGLMAIDAVIRRRDHMELRMRGAA